MVDTTNLYKTVTSGMKKYVGCPVIRANQNQEPPAYPYLTYTITTPQTQNKGTYGEYEDGKARKPVKQIWSITSQSDDDMEALNLANKAHEWLDYVATVYLNDNNVIVESVGNVGNRSNILTAEYQYRYGFDVTFSTFDEIELPSGEEIDSIDFGDMSISMK